MLYLNKVKDKSDISNTVLMLNKTEMLRLMEQKKSLIIHSRRENLEQDIFD
jgi:hypothetical protein